MDKPASAPETGVSPRTLLRLVLADLKIDVASEVATDELEPFLRHAAPFLRTEGSPDVTLRVGRPVSGPATMHLGVTSTLWRETSGAWAGWYDGSDLGFENLLRGLMSWELVERGGVLIHAAGLAEEGRGIAFPGVSGTGKSTLVLREPERRWLSEDLLAVAPSSEGYAVHSLPFRAANRLPIPPRKARLRAFVFIEKGVGLDIRSIGPRECLHRLGRALVWFAAPGLETSTLDRLLELSQAVPAMCMTIDRATPFWTSLWARVAEAA